ncbi:MAG: CDP-diacylglycerol--glycerol-3-phosphate 3-phosphatidyltransferase [Pseudomonadota bacterium]
MKGRIMFEQNGQKFWELPNIISVTRIASIPLIMVFLLWDCRWTRLIAAIIFTISSLSDLLDGYLARKLEKTSKAGKLLDPLADKLLMLAGLVMLIPLKMIPAWIVVIIIGREIAITGLRGIASSEGIIISASNWGKKKTLVLSIAAVMLIMGPQNNFFGVTWNEVGFILLLVGMGLSLYSGWDYFDKLKRDWSGNEKVKEEK